MPDDQRQGQDPGEVAAEVESAIYNRFGGQTGAEYSSKVRTLSFNLKDPNNPNLRARVLTGVVDPQVSRQQSASPAASTVAESHLNGRLCHKNNAFACAVALKRPAHCIAGSQDGAVLHGSGSGSSSFVQSSSKVEG